MSKKKNKEKLQRSSFPDHNRERAANAILEKIPGLMVRYLEIRDDIGIDNKYNLDGLDFVLWTLPSYIEGSLGDGFRTGGSSKEIKEYFRIIESIAKYISDNDYRKFVIKTIHSFSLDSYEFLSLYSGSLPKSMKRVISDIDLTFSYD